MEILLAEAVKIMKEEKSYQLMGRVRRCQTSFILMERKTGKKKIKMRLMDTAEKEALEILGKIRK